MTSIPAFLVLTILFCLLLPALFLMICPDGLKRLPDIRIGPGYMDRWWVIPRNRFFNIYLHKIMRDDDDRALHDHPWWSCSFLLKGELKEIHFNGVRLVPRFLPVVRAAKFAHRLEVVKGPVWTIFITGPVTRGWGFHCPQGWKYWKDYTTPDGVGVGVGCGEDIEATKPNPQQRPKPQGPANEKIRWSFLGGERKLDE